jgi:hypothetical protein
VTFRVALALAVVVAGADGFLLWARGLATPVGPDRAAASYLAAAPAGDLPGPRPPAGVYRYRTTGYERIDRYGVERRYPAETVRVVTWRGGCRWRETVPVFTQHVETYDFCATGADAEDFAYATVFVGRETVPTPAGPVPTRHLRLLTALSGQSEGGAVRDLWLDPGGLVVKEERQVGLRVRSGFVGLLTYEERASFVLSGRP